MRFLNYSTPRRFSIAEQARWKGATYVIRDVLTHDRHFAGFCQFKTRRQDGVIVWKPCPEGVEFSQIEPFEIEAHG